MSEHDPNPGIREGTQYLSAALRFAGGTVLFLFVGLALDKWLHTTPFLTVAGALGGAGLSFFSVYREFTADPDHPKLKQWPGKRRDSE
jgi:F0F1-type ATP synthase assembly protein I